MRYHDLISSESVHGDKWVARLRREHERHAGIPDWGYCPGRDTQRPMVREITSAMLAKQRQELVWSMKHEEVDEPEDDEWTNREGMPEFNGSFR